MENCELQFEKASLLNASDKKNYDAIITKKYINIAEKDRLNYINYEYNLRIEAENAKTEKINNFKRNIGQEIIKKKLLSIKHKKWITDIYLNDKDHFLQSLQDFGCKDFITKLQCTSCDEICKDINTGKMMFKENIHNKYWFSLSSDIIADPIKIYDTYFEKYKLFDKNVLIEFYNNKHGIGINVNKIYDDNHEHIQQDLERRKECETMAFYKTKDFYVFSSLITTLFSLFCMLSTLVVAHFYPEKSTLLYTTSIIFLVISCIGLFF